MWGGVGCSCWEYASGGLGECPKPGPPPDGGGDFLFSLRWLRFGGGAALVFPAGIWVSGQVGLKLGCGTGGRFGGFGG